LARAVWKPRLRFWSNRRSGVENVYESCGWCGREIRYGDVAVSVNLNVERADEQAGVEVIQSQMVLVLCASCGNGLDAGTLRQALETQRPA
jgi:hypothetical protein